MRQRTLARDSCIIHRGATMRPWHLWACVAGLLGAWVTWVVVDNYADGVDVQISEAHAEERVSTPAQVAQGAYLARAGNCMACHTVPGDVPYAGGRAIDTPFGKVYSSNLTPDPGTGLGQWNRQHFWRALHHGRSRDGRLLVPVFPYNHTSLITREDADALWAYLRSLPPVMRATPAHDLRWPYGTQAALAVWRSLYFKPAQLQVDPQHSEAYNRGAYLVLGLGHCAACHGARDALGATAALDDLDGGLMPVVHWYAPSLWRAQETALAQTPLDDTVRLLQTGRSAHAWVTGPMAEVVQHSTQYLNEADLRAMATYLQVRARQRDATEPAQTTVPGALASSHGAELYDSHCATCHGKHGEGVAHAYPPLAGNRALHMASTVNLVQTLMYGGFGPSTQAQPRPFGMPPFLLTLSDRDMADVLTHIRTQRGHAASPVTEFEVRQVREALRR